MGDMITTASGLQYEVLESGDGATPGPTDTVSAHYHGTFKDGRVFDSSVERGQPIDLPVNGVIAGWTEALQMMQEGDKWKLIVPPELGYGAAGVGPITGNTTLIFEVELITVRGK
jgi:FKBP-type peptidyl-prolyl cis-trans isomerase FklB